MLRSRFTIALALRRPGAPARSARDAVARLLLVVTPTLFAAAQAFAEGAEGGHGGGAADHHAHIENWWGLSNTEAPALGWVMVTFAIFVLGLLKAVKKPLDSALNGRADRIEGAIKEAANAKAEAQTKAREADEKLRSLDDEMKTLRGEFAERGEAEKKRLAAAGARAAERIGKDAEDTIAAEIDRAQLQLKQETAALAVSLAETRIKSALTAEDEKALQQRFLDQLAA